MSKVDQLKQWVQEICRGEKSLKNFMKVIEDSGEGDGSGKYKFKFKFNIYTRIHLYRITAIENEGEGYLGCTMSNRKPRAGEDWTRGRDLPDGKFTKEIWDKIKNAIIACELVELAPKQKKVLDEQKDDKTQRV